MNELLQFKYGVPPHKGDLTGDENISDISPPKPTANVGLVIREH
jgi:hypothetical protein